MAVSGFKAEPDQIADLSATVAAALEDAAVTPAPKRGRKSAREEVQAWLANVGLNPDLVDEAEGFDSPDDDPMPESAVEVRDEFRKILWRKRNDPSMKGIALTRSLESLSRIAELDEARALREAAAQNEVVLDVLDLIQTTPGLPTERKRELLSQEWDRCAARIERINEEVEALDGAD